MINKKNPVPSLLFLNIYLAIENIISYFYTSIFISQLFTSEII